MLSPAFLSRLMSMIGRIQGHFTTRGDVREAIGKKLATGGWAYEESTAPALYAFSVLGAVVVLSPVDEPFPALRDRLASILATATIEAAIVVTPNAHRPLPEALHGKPIRRTFVGGSW